MPDLSDEPLPLNVYNVPGIGTAQLCDAQRVDGTAGVEEVSRALAEIFKRAEGRDGHL